MEGRTLDGDEKQLDDSQQMTKKRNTDYIRTKKKGIKRIAWSGKKPAMLRIAGV
jgi:hypothetical protein